MYVPLDVNFPDDPRIEEVGLAAAGLYAQACCVAKRLGSEGALTKRQLLKLATDGEHDPEDLILRLLMVDLLVRQDGPEEYLIRAWKNHNRTFDENQGNRLNHIRWHEKKGRTDPGCRWCAKPQVTPGASGTESGAESGGGVQEVEEELEEKPSRARAARGRSATPEPEPGRLYAAQEAARRDREAGYGPPAPADLVAEAAARARAVLPPRSRS